MKKIFPNILLILFGLLIGLLIAELILRIYNPLPTRVVGNSLRLLKNYEKTIIIDNPSQQAGLDDTIYYSTNSIGFRGINPPSNLADYYSIFTVGGSTTECSLLDNTKTWTHILNSKLSQTKDSVWVNNAGIDGCSSFGHSVLLKEHIFYYNPDMVLFLVGLNEMYVVKNNEDSFLEDSREYRLRKFAQKSKLFSFLWNLRRQLLVRTYEMGHMSKKSPENLSKKEFKEKSKLYLNNQKEYKQRLYKLINQCINRNITPVLITQPIYNLTDLHPLSFVKYYNQTTIQVGLENDVLVIDLASKLEDNPDFYYDLVHYTNIGAEKVGYIIYEELINELPFSKKNKVH